MRCAGIKEAQDTKAPHRITSPKLDDVKEDSYSSSE